jgi:hypothetical protein
MNSSAALRQCAWYGILQQGRPLADDAPHAPVVEPQDRQEEIPTTDPETRAAFSSTPCLTPHFACSQAKKKIILKK